jgi:hypothetical protein
MNWKPELGLARDGSPLLQFLISAPDGADVPLPRLKSLTMTHTGTPPGMLHRFLRYAMQPRGP